MIVKSFNREKALPPHDKRYILGRIPDGNPLTNIERHSVFYSIWKCLPNIKFCGCLSHDLVKKDSHHYLQQKAS